MTAPLAAPPISADEWRQRWRFAGDPGSPRRRPTRAVAVGDIVIGGSHPIRVQSMTVSDTLDTASVVREIAGLVDAGCEIVRVTAPTRSAAENLGVIRAQLLALGLRVPLVADIHFTPQAALIAAEHADKIRVNPGNYADRKHFAQWEYTDGEYAAELERLEAAFRPLVLRCKERGVAMRIGTNHGSLSDRILNRYGDTPAGMVESALEFVRICELHGYRELVLSMKASDVKVMIQAYRLLAARMDELGMDYPFHLGVTEAGAGFAARIKSAIGIGTLLADGLGDTVRVSLAEDAVRELPLAQALASSRWLQAEPPTSSTSAPTIDPFRFERRRVRPVGDGETRLAHDRPPRLEFVCSLPPATVVEPQNAPAWLAGVREAAPAMDLFVVAADARTSPDAFAAWIASAARSGIPLGAEVPVEWSAVPAFNAVTGLLARVSLRGVPASFAELTVPPAIATALQYTFEGCATGPEVAAACAALVTRIETAGWPSGSVAWIPAPATTAIPTAVLRAFVHATSECALPLVLRARLDGIATRIDADVASDELRAAVATGGMLVDGLGDALQIEAEPARGQRLAVEILQATRLRLTNADFIACPSCGRTQFDLQSTTARIEARLKHLRGLKIAVMGCIVNGPGEMADADFGYVGSGPGRIDLYVGRERVQRGVLQDEAVDQLVALIQSRGQWVDPPSPSGSIPVQFDS